MTGIPRFWVLYEHMPASLAVGGVFFWFDGKLAHVAIALAFGWLVDADHLYDYLIWVKRSGAKVSVHDFISGRFFKDSLKVYVPFHAWEWVVVLGMLACTAGGYAAHFYCAASALLAHLIQDQLTNSPRALGYSISYRFYHDNRIDRFCRA